MKYFDGFDIAVVISICSIFGSIIYKIIGIS